MKWITPTAVLMATVGLALASAFPAHVADVRASGSTLLDADARAINAEQIALQPVVVAAEANPDVVGTYFEGTRLTVVTGGDEAHLSRTLDALRPAGAAVNVVHSPRTRSQLAAVRREIEDQLTTRSPLVAGVNVVTLDVRTAQVLVGLDDPAGPIGKAIAARYGSAVEVVSLPAASLLACVSRSDCGTKGGLAATTGLVICSTGFLVKNAVGMHMMTAGHCIKNAGGVPSNAVWRNPANTVTWGKNLVYSFNNNGPMDVGLFRITTPPSDRNQYFAGGTLDIRDVIAIAPENIQGVGTTVCRGGRTSGWDCGLITYRNVTVNVGTVDNEFLIRNAFSIRMLSAKGDSGSGVVTLGRYEDPIAAGILFGGTTDSTGASYTWYSTVEDADPFLSVTVCTTSAC